MGLKFLKKYNLSYPSTEKTLSLVAELLGIDPFSVLSLSVALEVSAEVCRTRGCCTISSAMVDLC